MFQRINNLFGRGPRKGAPLVPEPEPTGLAPRADRAEPKATYSKIFRWRLPDGQTHVPNTVEVVGSFTHWQKTPMSRDSALDAWHVALHHIQGNRTHHYMLLVDGKPAFDKTCDGLAVPHGPEEERFAMPSDKGPRVMMLFAQTK
jgi:hypothetical protein